MPQNSYKGNQEYKHLNLPNKSGKFNSGRVSQRANSMENEYKNNKKE